jgi:hypothetical protein
MITKALVIDEPWVSKILNGEKDWEMRSTNAHFRGRFGLIRKGSGLVVGVATLSDVSGPYSNDDIAFHAEHHRVGPDLYLQSDYKWRMAWHLEDVRKLAQPVRYQHKNGAVTWVELDDDAVEEIAAQLGDSLSTNVISVPPPRQADAKKPVVAGTMGGVIRSQTFAQLKTPVTPEVAPAKERVIAVGTVPQAKDGTQFTPAMCNNKGTYTVGEKGDEKKFQSYAEALAYLKSMPKAKWRRPNPVGNWGIVSAVAWVSAKS